MARPSELPRWADVGGDITEPNEGRKDVGHTPAWRVIPQFMNWLLNLIYLWITYLADDTKYHGADVRPQVFSADAFQVDNKAAISGGVLISLTGSSVTCRLPLSAYLPPGAVIDDITVYGKEGNVGGETYAATLYSLDTVGTSTTEAATQTSGTTNAQTNVGWTALLESLPTTDGLYLAVVLAATSAGGEVILNQVKVTWHHANP